MIDLLTIFHRGGAVLYTRSLSPVPGCPVDNLISSVLLEERSGQMRTGFRHEDKYTVKWSLANDLDLVFVAVYLNLTNLLYMDELLNAVRDRFCAMFRDAVLAVEGPASFRKFNRVLEEMVAKYEMPSGSAPGGASSTPGESGAPLLREEKKPAHAHGAKKNKQSSVGALASPQKGDKDDAAAPGPFDQAASDSSSSAAAPASSGTTIGGVNMEKLLAMQNAARGGKPTLNIKKKVKAPTAASDDAASKDGAPAPKKKVMAQSDKRVTKADLANLDYTKKIDGESAAAGERPESGFDNRGPVAGAYGDKISAEYSDDEEEEEVEVEDEEDDSAASAASSSSSAAAPAAKSGGFFSYFKTLVSGKVLTRDDLTPILQQFKENLNGKNVAAEISEHLAESVIKTLEGQKLASFTSVKSMVKTAVEAALTRILTPNRQIDVLQGVVEANEQKRPYSIVFVGVNGVGKSTSLAKTASYFLSKDLTVGVGAWSDRVEQRRERTVQKGVPELFGGASRLLIRRIVRSFFLSVLPAIRSAPVPSSSFVLTRRHSTFLCTRVATIATQPAWPRMRSRRLAATDSMSS